MWQQKYVPGVIRGIMNLTNNSPVSWAHSRHCQNYRGLLADRSRCRGRPWVAAKLAGGRRRPVLDIASEPAFPGSHAEPLSGRVLSSDFEHALLDGPVRGNTQASYFLHDVPHLQADGSTWGICTRRAGKLYKARSRLYRSQTSKYLLESSRRDLHNALESNPSMKRNG